MNTAKSVLRYYVATFLGGIGLVAFLNIVVSLILSYIEWDFTILIETIEGFNINTWDVIDPLSLFRLWSVIALPISLAIRGDTLDLQNQEETQ